MFGVPAQKLSGIVWTAYDKEHVKTEIMQNTCKILPYDIFSRSFPFEMILRG